jgi:SAM-dependent methyltransferase
MNKNEIQQTIDRYNKRLQEYGETEKALGWGDKGRSRLRYHALCAEFDLKNTTVIDFGCGFGDLYAYIRDTISTDFKYIGIDINPNLIEVAQKRYGSQAEFHVVPYEVSDYLEQHQIKADYILSSGIFNFKLDDNIGFIESTLYVFDRFSSRGFASNFLSDKVSFQADSNFHSNPGQILEMHYKYSNNITLRNNYMPFEFSVLVNKHDAVNKEMNVYESHLQYI